MLQISINEYEFEETADGMIIRFTDTDRFKVGADVEITLNDPLNATWEGTIIGRSGAGTTRTIAYVMEIPPND